MAKIVRTYVERGTITDEQIAEIYDLARLVPADVHYQAIRCRYVPGLSAEDADAALAALRPAVKRGYGWCLWCGTPTASNVCDDCRAYL